MTDKETTEESARTEEFKVDNDSLGDSAKNLIDKGNSRRIVVKNKDGDKVFELSLTISVILAIIFPWAAVIATVVALLFDSTISIEKIEKK